MRAELDRLRKAAGAELAPGTGSVAASSGVEITGVAIDSRKVQPGHLFACLPGERVDGHDYAQAAVKAGASAILAQRPVDVPVPVLICEDVTAALGRMAACWRNQTLAKVVGITGSAGKTTLKEILAHSFAAVGRQVSKTAGNFNNQLGLPLSIFAADEADDVWVLEAGVSRPGDMDELAAILRPDVAVIHNVGPAHLEALGDVAGVAREKAKLFDRLVEGGTAVACADYPELAGELAARPETAAVTFSATLSGNGYRGESLGADRADRAGPAGSGLYRLWSPGNQEGVVVRAPFTGAHFLENLLAALATLELFGLDVRALALGLERMAEQASAAARGADASGPVAPFAHGGRFNCLEFSGVTLIDDSYNANPLSMRRSIQAAREIADGEGEESRPLVLALGGMGELGDSAAAEHRELGRFIAELDGQAAVSAVFVRGAMTGEVLAGLRERGFSGVARETPTATDFLVELNALGLTNAVVLVKGSRSAAMDEFSAALGRTLESCEDASRGEQS